MRSQSAKKKGTDDSIVYDDHNAVWNVSVDRDDKTGDFIVTPSVNSAATLFTNDAGLRITKNVSAGTGATLTDADLVKNSYSHCRSRMRRATT